MQSTDTIEKLESYTLTNHINLTEIEAPPFMEEERAEAFAQLIRDIGVDSLWIDEVGNVIALLRGTEGNRTVALDAHLDTVFPKGTDVKVCIENDTVRAPGINEDNRGLAIAMVLTVFRAIKEMISELRMTFYL